MNKICVYAIAKNESKHVERWVKSMQGADHIIVLDTGSTDNTVELFSALGVEVHQKQYDEFRFDVARNDSLDLVPDEYNIRVCTDIDEAWEQDNWADLVREYWDEDKPRMHYHYVWNHTADGQNALEFNINKIHGRDPYLRWKGAAHEILTDVRTDSIVISAWVDMTDKLTLHHWADNTKDRRFYLDLMEQRAAEDPDNLMTWFLLGNEQRLKKQYEKAIESYNTLLEKFPIAPDNVYHRSSVYYHLGLCYKDIGDALSAISSFSLGIGTSKYYRDNYFGLGLIYVENQMWDAAIGILREGLNTSVRVNAWMDDPHTWTYALYDLLGLAYYAKEDYANAHINAKIALSYDPTNKTLRDRYNLYLQKLKEVI